MITKWKLFNFKSIRNETELTLAPLTIFAGSNSSGKSSVIQSMLLIAQTLSSQATLRPVVLNGSLVHLGQFDDIRSFNSETEQIVLGWDLAISDGSFGAFEESTGTWSYHDEVGYWNNEFGKLFSSHGEIAFDADPASPNRDLYQLQPRLFSIVLEALLRSAETEFHTRWAAVRSTSDSLNEKQRGLEFGHLDVPSTALQYDLTFDKGTWAVVLKSREQQEQDHGAEAIGCHFIHFLPERLYLRGDEALDIALEIFAIFSEGGGITMPTIATLAKEMPDQAWDVLAEVIDSHEFTSFRKATPKLVRLFSSSPMEDRKLEKRLANFINQHPAMQDLLATGNNEIAHRVATLVKQDRIRTLETTGGYRYYSEEHWLPAHMEAVNAFTKFKFVHLLKYLGPLRDEPKPLYSVQASAAPTDVGLHGEMTAAVLEVNKDVQVKYLPPSIFDEPLQQRRTVVRTLQSAVNEWLRYLGVAEAVETSEMGKLGYQMQVVAEADGKSMDLTHVGVGVSQVLPILVLCLLAKPDTTIILEQPELHLHPKVQTLLADFFLAIALSDQQIIVETHSEYLINRLRFRAAATATESALHEMLQIYFVEKKNGNSEFRPVIVNDYGAIVDWPDGFFDQSQIEAEAILRAATRKRKQTREGDRHV